MIMKAFLTSLSSRIHTRDVICVIIFPLVLLPFRNFVNVCLFFYSRLSPRTNFKEDEKLWTDGLDGVVVQENATVPRRPFTPGPTLGWPLNRGSSKDDKNHSNNPAGAAGYIPK